MELLLAISFLILKWICFFLDYKFLEILSKYIKSFIKFLIKFF